MYESCVCNLFVSWKPSWSVVCVFLMLCCEGVSDLGLVVDAVL